jgi:hypothetical protein
VTLRRIFVDIRRSRRLAASLLALVVIGSAAACSSPAPLPLSLPSVSQPPASIDPSPNLAAGVAGPFKTTGRGPAVPKTDAWLGAFVGSTDQTATGKTAAVTGFQDLIGRQLAVVHSFHPWGSTFPSPFDRQIVSNGQIDLVSWAGTNTRSIAQGVYDGQLKSFAQSVRNFGTPILLRFRWEMDRPNLAETVGSGADYVAAWKHVRQIFTDAGATNAGWVWCPTSDAFANGTADSYYPGDDQVDWLCTDVYPNNTDLSFAAIMAPVLQFAAKHPQPLLIGEMGVETTAPDGAAWLAKVAPVLASQPQVKAVIYFSNATTTKPIYDTTVGESPQTLAAFQAMAAAKALSAPAFR